MQSSDHPVKTDELAAQMLSRDRAKPSSGDSAHAGDDREELGIRRDASESDSSDHLLDPLCRALAIGLEWKSFGPATTGMADAPSAEPVAAAARVSLEQVLDQLVKKIAWSGDSRAGTARVELGAGALAGATLLVQAEGSEVRVTLELPPGVDAAGWRDRLERRLSARGLRISELEVR